MPPRGSITPDTVPSACGVYRWMILLMSLPGLASPWMHRHKIRNDIPEVVKYVKFPPHASSRTSGDTSRPCQTGRPDCDTETDRTSSRKAKKELIRKTKSDHKLPHIVFILADDLGYADVGYHNNYVKTPSIDFLAKTGIRLENYYSQQICAPSRAVLLTGKYVSHNKLGHNISPRDAVCLPQEHHLLPQELKAHGYSTHLVGKWHMGRSSWECLPQKRGFDSFVGIHGGGASYVDHRQKYNSDHFGYALYNGTRVALEHRGTYAPEIYKARATELIKQHRRKKSKPLFLMLATQLVHAPNFDMPAEYMNTDIHHNDTMRAIHTSQATVLDGVVDSVVRALKKNRMWGNTVLIFSSDNGGIHRFGGSNVPLRGWKGDFFEGGVRVPAFINSPLIPMQARSRVFPGLMGMVDWYSTIIKGILGKTWTKNIDVDSVNLWGRFSDPLATSARKQYLLSLGSACFDNKVDNRTAYRWNEWKYIELEKPNKDNESVFLFNLTADPLESENLSKLKPKMLRTIKKKLRRNFCGTAQAPLLPEEVSASSPEHSDGILKPWL